MKLKEFIERPIERAIKPFPRAAPSAPPPPSAPPAAAGIIDFGRIEKALSSAAGVVKADDLEKILDRAGPGGGIGLEGAAKILQTQDPKLLELALDKAREVKERVFGTRIVLFAPLYLTNHCVNGCLYCGFRAENSGVERKALTVDETVAEARTLEMMGFTRLLLVAGEDPARGVDYITEAVRAVLARTGIRVVHVNAPPMDAHGLRRLKKSGVGVFQAFQETYHRPTYELMHPRGPKKDYSYRLDVMDRALGAGFQDVGIGTLLGLHDYHFDVLATIAHSMHLYSKYGTHAHTVSVPRLRPAEGSTVKDPPWPVTDTDMKKITAAYRLALPTVGVVVTTRESAELRAELIRAGASQISAASRTVPGGYARGSRTTLEQFSTNDRRALGEVMASVARGGCMPSLCATCYRVGRVGKAFTETARHGAMKDHCRANAILTLKEYLLDHCDDGPNGIGDTKTIHTALGRELDAIEDPAERKRIEEKLDELEKGARDIYF